MSPSDRADIASWTERSIQPLECDLCGEPMRADPAVLEATGLNICPHCLEDALDASADEPRTEVGMVGGRH
jgi:hypothetical protein